MIRDEGSKVKEIDRRILEELREKLEIKIRNVDVVDEGETEKILNRIEEKKKAIFLLFQGEFTQNEQNIKERMTKRNKEVSFYDRIANNVISKRVEKIFNKMMSVEAQDYRLVSVCADRHFFIQEIISENIEISFIEACINRER